MRNVRGAGICSDDRKLPQVRSISRRASELRIESIRAAGVVQDG
jgi:hypothetical protein